MKKTILALFIMLIMFICIDSYAQRTTFSVKIGSQREPTKSGNYNNLMSGVRAKYKKMWFETGDFVERETQKKLNRKQLPMGTRIAIRLEKVKGISRNANGKVNLGLKLAVYPEKDEAPIYETQDLAADMGDIDPEDTSTLSAFMRIDSPMEVGKSYKIEAKFWDKNDQSREILTWVNVTIVE